MRDLEEAISMARQAVDGVPEDHPRLTGYLNSLGRMLGKRYMRTGRMQDLEEAIHKAEQEVDMTPEGHLNCQS